MHAQIKPLVDNADAVLKWSKRLLGESLVSAILRRTFFRHFCAGKQRFPVPALTPCQEDECPEV